MQVDASVTLSDDVRYLERLAKAEPRSKGKGLSLPPSIIAIIIKVEIRYDIGWMALYIDAGCHQVSAATVSGNLSGCVGGASDSCDCS